MFSIHCSASSDASFLLWNLLISSSVKSRTSNTTWQDWVWHFWDSQAISHRFSVKTATAPLVFQMACEMCTRQCSDAHRCLSCLRSGLVAVTASWQSHTRKRQHFWYAQLALCTATRALVCGASECWSGCIAWRPPSADAPASIVGTCDIPEANRTQSSTGLEMLSVNTYLLFSCQSSLSLLFRGDIVSCSQRSFFCFGTSFCLPSTGQLFKSVEF